VVVEGAVREMPTYPAWPPPQEFASLSA